jgi:hypothetical protein
MSFLKVIPDLIKASERGKKESILTITSGIRTMARMASTWDKWRISHRQILAPFSRQA